MEHEKAAIRVFKNNGGILTTTQAMTLGIHPRTLYSMRNTGAIETLQRGLYCIPGLPNQLQPDLAIISKKIPKGIICLISALYFHNLTTEIPHCVHMAVEKGSKPPKLNFPPTHFYWFSGSNFADGVEEHLSNGVLIRCYSKEKTIVDCFRYRHKLGIDICLDALKKYWRSKSPNLTLLQKLAERARVANVMKPYIETLIHESS